MKLTSMVFTNLTLGPLQGTMGFVAEFVEEGNDPPSAIGKQIADGIRRTVRTTGGTAILLVRDIDDGFLYTLFQHLRTREQFPYVLQVVLVVEQGELGSCGALVDFIIVRTTETGWRGIMGNALVMTLEHGLKDPTDGYPLGIYPGGYYLEKGPNVMNEQFVLFTLKYPKWKLSVPPRYQYTLTIYPAKE